jgi:hypothetical protein
MVQVVLTVLAEQMELQVRTEQMVQVGLMAHQEQTELTELQERMVLQEQMGLQVQMVQMVQVVPTVLMGLLALTELQELMVRMELAE